MPISRRVFLKRGGVAMVGLEHDACLPQRAIAAAPGTGRQLWSPCSSEARPTA